MLFWRFLRPIDALYAPVTEDDLVINARIACASCKPPTGRSALAYTVRPRWAVRRAVLAPDLQRVTPTNRSPGSSQRSGQNARRLDPALGTSTHNDAAHQELTLAALAARDAPDASLGHARCLRAMLRASTARTNARLAAPDAVLKRFGLPDDPEAGNRQEERGTTRHAIYWGRKPSTSNEEHQGRSFEILNAQSRPKRT